MKKKVTTTNIGILGNMDATEIAEKIKAGEFSVQEAIDCVRERAKVANPVINAITASNYVNVDRNYEPNRVFSGVPTYAKDLVDVKDFSTRHGSLGIPDTPKKKNDKIVEQFKSSGVVILGKSTTSEFGLLPSCETNLMGDTRNPRNTGYSTGGSSGGAGALVASGVVPIAHAADGGGSIRIPASCCGLIGLKPSRGRHMGSPTAKMYVDIVTQGIVSKTVRDTANYFAAIEAYHQTPGLPNIGKIEHAGKKRLKIGVFTQSPADIESHPDVVKAIHDSAKSCENLGHQVEYIDNPFGGDILFDFLVYYSFLTNNIKAFGKVVYHKGFKTKKVEPFTANLGRYFKKLMLLAPSGFKRLKHGVVKEYNALFERFDVLLSPTLSSPVPKLGYLNPNLGFISLVMKLNTYVNFTIIQNATGAPAISLPMGKCSNGLPIGSMFAAQIGEEGKLLELAFELEEAGLFSIE